MHVISNLFEIPPTLMQSQPAKIALSTPTGASSKTKIFAFFVEDRVGSLCLDKIVAQ